MTLSLLGPRRVISLILENLETLGTETGSVIPQHQVSCDSIHADLLSQHQMLESWFAEVATNARAAAVRPRLFFATP